MVALLYYLSLPVLYFLSILPFWWMYRLSDLLYLLLYYLVRYRRKVVYQNLRNSFPDKSEVEISAIARRFYRYLCDLILETFKTLTIGEETLRKHVEFDSTIFRQFYERGQSVIIVMGHFGNWELGGARFALEPIHQLFVIYHPLKEKHFEGLIRHMRMRLGNDLYAMNRALKGMLSDRDKVTATAFIADQTPSSVKAAYWMEFLNQDTPIFQGTEKIAAKLRYPVVYISVRRRKRGLYCIDSEVLFEHSEKTAPGEISEAHTRRLEKDILEQPEIWLWTHRRWKRKRPAAVLETSAD